MGGIAAQGMDAGADVVALPIQFHIAAARPVLLDGPARGDPRHDVLFVGHQAAGTPGRAIQQYGPRGGYVELDGERYDIRARIHTLGGYSAHADQQNLLDFIGAMSPLPQEVILVHGEAGAKRVLQAAIEARFSGVKVRIP